MKNEIGLSAMREADKFQDSLAQENNCTSENNTKINIQKKSYPLPNQTGGLFERARDENDSVEYSLKFLEEHLRDRRHDIQMIFEVQ